MGRLKGIKMISEGLKKVLKVVLTKSFNTFWPPQIFKIEINFQNSFLRSQKVKLLISTCDLRLKKVKNLQIFLKWHFIINLIWFLSSKYVVFSFIKCHFRPRATRPDMIPFLKSSVKKEFDHFWSIDHLKIDPSRGSRFYSIIYTVLKLNYDLFKLLIERLGVRSGFRG